MNIADLLIHIPADLSGAARAGLEGEVRKISGVVAPRFNARTPHLLLIAYDPAATGSDQLLQRVRTCGYEARVVGL